MGDEEGTSTEEHKDFGSFVLFLYGPNLTNIVASFGDNCATNKHFAPIFLKD